MEVSIDPTSISKGPAINDEEAVHDMCSAILHLLTPATNGRGEQLLPPRTGPPPVPFPHDIIEISLSSSSHFAIIYSEKAFFLFIFSHFEFRSGGCGDQTPDPGRKKV